LASIRISFHCILVDESEDTIHKLSLPELVLYILFIEVLVLCFSQFIKDEATIGTCCNEGSLAKVRDNHFVNARTDVV